MEYELIKKITTKTVFGDVKTMARQLLKEAAEKGGKPRTFHVMRVYGQAASFSTGETTLGEYTRFLGSFRAETHDPETGEITGFKAPVALFPRFLEEQIKMELVAAGEPIRFGFDISARPDDEMAADYEYVATPLMETAADLDSFAQAFQPIDARLLLAAPKEPAAIEAPKTKKEKAAA
jgi:hypothetical protein